MSNTNNNLQTQTSNALQNAIMEAGGKDCPPMLAPSNYVQWKSRIKRYIDTKPNNELIHYCLQNPPYKFKWTEKIVPVTEGIDNDIYSTVDACPNACEMWKAIERLKQGKSINVQDLETNLYWEFRKFTSRDGESLESYYSRMAKNKVNEIRAERLARTANLLALVAQQQPVYHPQNHPNHYTQNSSTRSQQAATRNRDDEMSKEKEIAKLMALISLSFKKIYKPTNNKLRTSSNTSRENQDNTPRNFTRLLSIVCVPGNKSSYDFPFPLFNIVHCESLSEYMIPHEKAFFIRLVKDRPRSIRQIGLHSRWGLRRGLFGQGLDRYIIVHGSLRSISSIWVIGGGSPERRGTALILGSSTFGIHFYLASIPVWGVFKFYHPLFLSSSPRRPYTENWSSISDTYMPRFHLPFFIILLTEVFQFGGLIMGSGLAEVEAQWVSGVFLGGLVVNVETVMGGNLFALGPSIGVNVEKLMVPQMAPLIMQIWTRSGFDGDRKALRVNVGFPSLE
ncbi:hypothetical protein Tco_0531589 [Tanacetum coccineum]